MNTQGSTKKQTEDHQKKMKQIQENMSRIKHKLIVMSGKGGVGKSTVAVNLAYGLLFQGNTVGLLDVDLHGPSIPHMLGLKSESMQVKNDMIEPTAVTSGFKVISIGSQLKDNRQPLIWRGPIKMGVIQQFLGDVNWGELDYLVIDLPPGTGDEPLSIAQHIPEADGVIIVTTPQEVALLDARKSVVFAKELNLPIVGIIENMSGLICPHCGEKINPFKYGGGEKAAEELGVPFLGHLPMDPDIVESSDEGKPFIQSHGKSAAAASMEDIVHEIIGFTEKTKS